jgi:folate-binding protein YgfZ
MTATALRVARRPREFVGVRGPDAASYLQAMVSNDVEALGIGGSCDALLLTAKARVIAPLVVLRRGVGDFLLLTEEGLGERVRSTLLRSRLAAKCEIELEEHSSVVVLGGDNGVPTADFGVPAVEVFDDSLEPTIADEELELLRIRAGTPRFGREIDDRVLPAEAGLDMRAVDFEKGCYPGQEPIARQHYRGRVNRTLRVLEIDGSDVPEVDAELSYEGKVVGRVTSSVGDGAHIAALGYVRVEVPPDAILQLGRREVRPA